MSTGPPRLPIPAVSPGDRSGSNRPPLFKMDHLRATKTPAERATLQENITRIVAKTDGNVTDAEDASHSNEKSIDEKDEDDAASDVSMDDGEPECVDAEEYYDEYLWEIFAVKCLKEDWSILECMHQYLALYHELERDEPYEEIMEDVKKAQTNGKWCFTKALDWAIEKNKDLITSLVADYRDGDDYDGMLPTIWDIMASPDQFGCKWFTGTECDCNGNGCSWLNKFRSFALIFHAMDMDEIVGNIDKAVDERSEDTTRDEAIDKELKVREEAILERFKEAKERLERLDMDETFWRESWRERFGHMQSSQ